MSVTVAGIMLYLIKVAAVYQVQSRLAAEGPVNIVKPSTFLQ
jgi:hypothetical protein